MGILQINTDVAGQIDINPRRVKIISSDNLATVTAAGYLNNSSLQGFVIKNTDIIDMWYGASVSVGGQISSPGTYATFTPSISNGVITLVNWVNLSNVLLPVVSGNVAKFNGTTGQISDSNVAASSIITSSNAAGQTIATSSSSATPGTLRALIGSMTESASVMTSGNVVGVRGVVNNVGASGGFIYGAQGKVISTGTLSGSSWTAGVFGQLDISAATINAGQCAPIWGDYGSSSGTLTDQTGLYGIAMTNTTAAVLEGQIYLYGGAQNLLLLSTNAGLSGVTYFIDSGVSAGSWGNATPPTPSKVLRISVDGTQYYLPLVAQNT